MLIDHFLIRNINKHNWLSVVVIFCKVITVLLIELVTQWKRLYTIFLKEKITPLLTKLSSYQFMSTDNIEDISKCRILIILKNWEAPKIRNAKTFACGFGWYQDFDLKGETKNDWRLQMKQLSFKHSCFSRDTTKVQYREYMRLQWIIVMIRLRSLITSQD